MTTLRGSGGTAEPLKDGFVGHIYVCISVTVVGDGLKDEGIEQGAVGGRVWSIWTVTGVALN